MWTLHEVKNGEFIENKIEQIASKFGNSYVNIEENLRGQWYIL